MTLASRGIEFAKGVDSLLGRPLAKAAHGGQRPLPSEPSNVLAIRLWGLGNLALLAPQFAASCDIRVRLLTLKQNAPFVRRYFPHVELLNVPAPSSLSFPGVALALARKLRRDPPDVIVDCEQFLRLPLALARWASGAPCVGLDTPGQGRRPLLDSSLAYDPFTHVGQSFASLWDKAGLPSCRTPGGLICSAQEHEELRRRWGLDARPLVVLHPGSGDHFPGRRWPAERFGELLLHLAADGQYQFVLTGNHNETHLAAVARAVALQTPHAGDVHDLSGRLSIEALVELLGGAALLVTNDTGPLHIADALGTATVALFGPNTPHRYGPRHAGSVALYAELPCSPCLDARNMKRSSCRHYSCMTALTVSDVSQACKTAMASPSSPPSSGPHALTP
ncbi:MAG: ADP-heptose:LPS heptosyltransferase [Pseudohongiellaceae bacterium]|jgi:ADP-heptose:LPS heptosyltransferase